MGDSIATRTGDDGTTGLIFNKRVSKTDLRIEANGWVDELNARLGLAKASLDSDQQEGKLYISSIQRNLISLMGEIALDPEDFDRYAQSKMQSLSPDFLKMLDERVSELEAKQLSFLGWATPGASHAAAGFDAARTACRSAERAVLRIREAGLLNPASGPLILKCLNRLSDVLWLEARDQETQIAGGG